MSLKFITINHWIIDDVIGKKVRDEGKALKQDISFAFCNWSHFAYIEMSEFTTVTGK
jgi:hypothetical protein